MNSHVVCKQVRFCQARGASRKYYTSGDYLKYISRLEAVQTQKEPGLINLNTLETYSFDDYQRLKDKFSNLNEKQIIWDYVISFSKEFELEKHLESKEDVANILSEPLEQFFKKNHLEMNDFEIFGALHKNTDHLHMHVGFFEKKEIYIDKNGNKQFQKVGKLGGKNVSLFKELGADVEYFCEKDYFTQQLIKHRNQIKTDSEKQIKKTDFSSLISHFVKKNIHSFQFNSLDKETREMVNKMVNELIESDKNLKNSYFNYKETLLKLKDYHSEKNDSYKLEDREKENQKWFDFENEKVNFILGNKILKSIKEKVISKFDELEEEEKLDCRDVVLENVKINIESNLFYKKRKKQKMFRHSLKEKMMKVNATSDRKAYLAEFNSSVARSLKKIKNQVNYDLNKKTELAENLFRKLQEEKWNEDHLSLEEKYSYGYGK